MLNWPLCSYTLEVRLKKINNIEEKDDDMTVAGNCLIQDNMYDIQIAHIESHKNIIL